jgi:hypothetical protein
MNQYLDKVRRIPRWIDEALMSWKFGVPVKEIPDFVEYLETKRRARRVAG